MFSVPAFTYLHQVGHKPMPELELSISVTLMQEKQEVAS